jgi:hypothetical protein
VAHEFLDVAFNGQALTYCIVCEFPDLRGLIIRWRDFGKVRA